MKAKNSLHNVVLILCALCCGCNKSPTQSPGRYQIYSGTYDSIVGNDEGSSSETGHMVIKIDTITGQTWEYVATTIVGSNYTDVEHDWREIKNASTNAVH
jgi:hypothetical protein